MKVIRDIKRARRRGATLRPLWQIVGLVPLWLVYLPARKFVDWMDSI